MSGANEDARLRELIFLDQLEKNVTGSVGPLPGDCPERRLYVHLLAEGYVNDASRIRFTGSNLMAGFSGKEVNLYAAEVEELQWGAIRQLMDGNSVNVQISHRGAVRRAELEQALLSDRIKDPFGLVWDGRHFRRDTRLALLDVTESHPLAITYLDLNDVKAFNDVSHDTGDDALKRYLEVVADYAALTSGSAYRLSGGADEVILWMPDHDLEAGLIRARGLIEMLGRQFVAGKSLRVAAGLLIVQRSDADVGQLKKDADLLQKRAKEPARSHAERASHLAWGQSNLQPFQVSKPE